MHFAFYEMSGTGLSLWLYVISGKKQDLTPIVISGKKQDLTPIGYDPDRIVLVHLQLRTVLINQVILEEMEQVPRHQGAHLRMDSRLMVNKLPICREIQNYIILLYKV